MGRLVNGERKITKPIPEHAGKLLIFCEGSTEYNYMDYFKKYLEKIRPIPPLPPTITISPDSFKVFG